MLSAYRDHGQPLARGSDAGMVMAELFGRGTGYSKGKGGSMHIFDIEHHFYGGYGIVGGQIPLAAGMAFASRYRNEDRVTVCFFGDAAANQGALPRDVQHGGQVEAARHLHLREQPLRHGHGDGPHRGGAGDLQARVRLRHARRAGGRHGLPDDVRDGEGRRRVLPRRQGPGAAGGQHLPLPRPLHGRPRQLPHQAGGGGGAQERPHPQAARVRPQEEAGDRRRTSRPSTRR